MWTLQRPDAANALAHLDKALTRADGSKDYTPTPPELAALHELYGQYDAGLGAPQAEFRAPPNLSAAFRDAIFSAYAQVQKRRRLAALRGELLAAAPRCPYCGISAVTDLDHFIPKEAYRSFAVYCRNLVPCCSVCNNKKRALDGANAGQRFLHPYLETTPAGLFFQATASIQAGALKVTFDVDDAIVPDVVLRNRLRFQIRRLQLNERYQAEINVVLSPFAGHLLEFGGSPESAPQVAQFLALSAASERRHVGPTHWRPLVFDAVASCQDFCDGGFRVALGLEQAAAEVVPA
jgi:hypothetical protein